MIKIMFLKNKMTTLQHVFWSSARDADIRGGQKKSGARLPTLQLTISHSQRLNSGKPLGTGCCEWLWSIAMWANGTLPRKTALKYAI